MRNWGIVTALLAVACTETTTSPIDRVVFDGQQIFRFDTFGGAAAARKQTGVSRTTIS